MEQILFMPKMLRGSQENTKFNHNLLGNPTQRKHNIHKYFSKLTIEGNLKRIEKWPENENTEVSANGITQPLRTKKTNAKN
jgi:hypothetical protein